jgi:glycosyltransferase involved in cell wall biosynthesis
MEVNNPSDCDVSIVLCSHNRAEHLAKTLQALERVCSPEDVDAEIVLVDNASSDATPDVMRAYAHPTMPVRVVRENKKGLSHARNRAVQEARGQVLLFTDDDVRFPEQWVERMSRPILQDEADAVAGGVELAPSLKAAWMTPHHRGMLASTEQIDPEEPSRFVGANMAIGRHAFQIIPAFDPELGAGQLGMGEETLFAWQMRAVGLRIASAFDVAVEHYPDPSRLRRDAWKAAADKAGRSEAYRSYHWEHRTYSLPALWGGWGLCVLQLWWGRVRGGAGGDANSEMPAWEFQLRRRIARIRQHLRERGTPKKYDERGMVKKDLHARFGEVSASSRSGTLR